MSVNYIQTLRTVWKYAKSHRRVIFALMGLSLILSAIDLGIPYLMGLAIDGITEHLGLSAFGINWDTALIAVIGYAILNFLFLGLDQLFERIHLLLARNLYFEHLVRLFKHWYRLPMSFLVEQRLGEVINKFDRAAESLDVIIGRTLIRILPLVLTLLGILGLSFVFDWRLGIALAGAVVLFVISVLLTTPLQARAQSDYDKTRNKIRGEVMDGLYNVLSVKALGGEGYEERQLHKKYLDIMLGLRRRVIHLNASTLLVRRFIVRSAWVGYLAVVVYLLRGNLITVGLAFAFSSYMGRIFYPIMDLARRWDQVRDGLIAMDFAERVYQVPTETYRPENAVKLKECQGKVVFENLWFRYPDDRPKDWRLKNITFSVRPGEVVAFVGRSGSGKTTLTKLLMGFYMPIKGSLSIDETPIEQLDLEVYRKQLALVPQEITLFNNTIGWNIKYGTFRAKKSDMEHAARQAHILKFIKSLPKKWRQQVGEKGLKLSGGQKQRVAIARAILRDPRILILDEPTSALDAESEHLVTRALDKLMKGRTTFIIAHRLSTVRRADKIIVLDKGKIVEMGNHTQLLKKGGLYKELHDLQIGLY